MYDKQLQEEIEENQDTRKNDTNINRNTNKNSDTIEKELMGNILERNGFNIGINASESLKMGNCDHLAQSKFGLGHIVLV